MIPNKIKFKKKLYLRHAKELRKTFREGIKAIKKKRYFKWKKKAKRLCMLFKDKPVLSFYKTKKKKMLQSLSWLFIKFLLSAQIHIGNAMHIELIHIIPNILGTRNNLTVFNLNIFLINFKKVLHLLSKLYYYRKTMILNTVRSKNKLPSFIINNISGTNNVLTTKNRWVGGTLTNFVKIQKATRKNLLRKNLKKLSKKYRYRIATRTLLRKKKFLSKFPHFFFSLVKNHTALNEGIHLGLKTTQICDSDYDNLMADFNLFLGSSIPALLFIVYMITEMIREIKKKDILYFFTREKYSIYLNKKLKTETSQEFKKRKITSKRRRKKTRP